MNMLAQFQTQQTMSNREIAQLCNKKHGHVCRDIENLNESYEKLGLSKIGQGYFTHPSTGNQQHRHFLLTKEQCVDLVTGYNSELRIKINRRWAELESQATQPQFKIPTSLSEALQLAADQARQLELAAPKVQYFDRVADTKNLLNASQVGKKVGMSAVRLNQYLADIGVYDRRIAGRTFAQWFIDKGYGEVKQTEQGYPQSKFTNKGEQWVIEQLVSEGVVA